MFNSNICAFFYSRRVKKFYSCILTELYLQVGDEKPGDSKPGRWVCGELTSTEIWGRSVGDDTVTWR